MPGKTGQNRQLNKKLRCRLLKAEKFFVCAIHADMQRLFVVQTEHADKAFCVDLLLFITHKHLKRLGYSKRYKFFHVPERLNCDVELMHPWSPVLYKIKVVGYNGENTHDSLL